MVSSPYVSLTLSLSTLSLSPSTTNIPQVAADFVPNWLLKESTSCSQGINKLRGGCHILCPPSLLHPFTFLTLICSKWTGWSLWAHFLLSFHSGESEHLKNFKSRFIKMPGNYVQNFQPLSAAVSLSYSLSLSLPLCLLRQRWVSISQLHLPELSLLTHPTCPLQSLHTLRVCLPMPSLSLPCPSLSLTLLDKFA